jgi:asparagine synthase (glutamine-hydrolysing)
MNKKIIHRGPDDQSEFEHFIMNRYVSFGMTRLSIIDLSKGNQPIYSKDKSLVIVFNGEIYNFQSLRQDLVNHYDIEFNTSSDTEVILMMYEIYGVESFSKLDGMFAFSILDKNIGKVFIARDFFGEKPLYYSQQLDSIIWGFRIKVFNDKPKD